MCRKKFLTTLASVNGITLLELLIAISLSGIVAGGIYNLCLNTTKSYNFQIQLTEMHQNATYTMNCLSGEIMQAGADLPDTGLEVIRMKPGKNDSISLCFNPVGANYTFTKDTLGTVNLLISDAVKFLGVDTIVKLGLTKKLSFHPVVSVNTSTNPNNIRFASPTNFYRTETIFAFYKTSFFLSGTNFCRGNIANVLSENIDSLSISFYQKDGSVSNDWSTMSYAKISVRARTANAFKHQSSGDGYDRLTLTMDVRVRNRF